MTTKTFLALAAAPLLWTASSPAAAAPQVQLERCVGLDRAELARAIDDELAASLPAGKAADLIISASCDDGVSATVRISERGGSRRAERTLALGEVTGELRPRLVALVALELAESVLAAPATPAPPAAPATPPPAVELSLRRAPEPAPAAPAAALPEAERPPGLSSALTLVSGSPRPLALSLGLGTRVYFAKPDPMIQLTLELDLSSFSVGVVGARSSAEWTVRSGLDGEEPKFIPYSSYLGGFSLRGRLFCVRGQERELCVEIHGEAGYTRVYAANVSPSYTNDDLRGQYLMAAAVAEGRQPLGKLEASLRLEIGASDGDDVLEGDSYVTSFSGAVAMMNLGMRWKP